MLRLHCSMSCVGIDRCAVPCVWVQIMAHRMEDLLDKLKKQKQLSTNTTQHAPHSIRTALNASAPTAAKPRTRDQHVQNRTHTTK